MNSPRLCLYLPAAVATVCLAALAFAAYGGWPGETGVEGGSFCEPLPSGTTILQPANTWSNLGFVLVGIAIGWQASRDVARAKSPDWNNPMVSSVGYPTGYAVTAVLLGFGSAAMHASMTGWGGTLDLFSMHLWAAWVIAYATMRLARGGDRWFSLTLFALLTLLGMRMIFGDPTGLSGSDLFGVMILSGIAIEVVGRARNRSRKTDGVYLLLACAAFLIAYAVWHTGIAGSHPDQPHTLCYGHAMWHMLCAVSVGFVYLYGRSERWITATPTPG